MAYFESSMARHARQQQFKFRTWGGKRKGAGRKRHTHELPHVARPELHSRHPQHVTIPIRPDVISLLRAQHQRAGP